MGLSDKVKQPERNGAIVYSRSGDIRWIPWWQKSVTNIVKLRE